MPTGAWSGVYRGACTFPDSTKWNILDNSKAWFLKPAYVSIVNRSIYRKNLTSFMVSVCKNEEDILQDWDEELLKEGTGCLRVRFRDVVDKLDTHAKSSTFNFAIIMLTSPQTSINNKFELSVIEFQEG